jgi:hypothetical protein
LLGNKYMIMLILDKTGSAGINNAHRMLIVVPKHLHGQK